MKKGKKILTTSGIFTGIFAVSFGAAFFSQYKPVQKNSSGDPIETPVVRPETDQQRVLNSLLNINAFEVNGNIDMIAKDNTSIGVALNAQGDLTNLDDIKLQGNVDVALNESHLKANFGYFEEELYFDYNESYFKLDTSKLLDFIKMLPTNYNMNLELPTEIEELDLNAIEAYFDDMSDKQLTPDGQNYYFTINLSQDVNLYVITDLDLNFAGLRTGTIDYHGMIFKLNVSLTKLSTVNLVNPKYTEDYEKYQDFSPAFKLFDGIYALTQEKKNTVNADLQIRKVEEDTSKTILNTNVDLTYDLESENHLFGLEGNMIGTNSKNEEVEVPYSFAIYNKNLFAHYGDIAIQVETDSVSELINYILGLIGDSKVEEVISGLTKKLASAPITDTVAKANDILGTITLTEDELGVDINTSNFSTTKTNEKTGEEETSLSLSNLHVVIKFNSSTGALESIQVKNFRINSYEADLSIAFVGYKGFALDNVNYQKIDHLFAIARFYETYKDLNKFRIEFDGKVSKDSEEIEGKTVNYNDILIDGGLQFELDPLRGQEGHINVGYGYGNVAITDRKNVQHNLKADMKNVDEVLLSYSTVTGTSRDNSVDPMNVKIKVQTMKDLVEIVSDIIKNPDEHFEEIVSKLFDRTQTLPIEDIIGGNYLQLLTTNLVNRFEVGDDYVEIDVALDVLGMDDQDFTVRVEFTTTEKGIEGLKALKISNFKYQGLSLEFNAYLKDFDENLESTRLLPSEAADYIDFSDLKVLLQLGINTSKNNYYHFTANAKVTISLFSISLDVPLDIKVWTDHGDVKVSVDLTDIPAIVLVNGKTTTNNRNAHIYYHDGLFYVQRSETYTEGILFWKETHSVEHIAKYDLDMFMDNILDILCGDILCLSDTIMNEINKSVNKTKDENYQMKYENILNDFLYSKSGHYFYFDINLAEIANNDQLSSFTVKVLTDNSDTSLTGLNVKLTVKLTSLLSLVLNVDLTLADCSLVADASNNLTALDAFESRMSGYAVGYKTTTDRVI